MKSFRTINNIFFMVLCAIFITGKSFAEPTNLNQVREELKIYHDSGKYLKEISKVAKKADAYIYEQVKDNLQSANPRKLAVVLDIDETSLSNYEHMAKNDFYYDPNATHNEILKANSPGIKPVLNMYRHAIKNKVSVFFVTGRPDDERKATVRNLHKAGFTKFTALYTRPQNYKKASIQEFKTTTREIIESKGYTIIASIGDQKSDLEGGHTKSYFKIPNPYYFIK